MVFAMNIAGILAAVLLAPVALTVATGAATAATAGVSISGTAATNGTTTVSYRATATRAGRLRDIVVSIPPGSAGRITSVNGTVRTISPGVLRWLPSTSVTVAVGTRFSIPLYGIRLPSGGPWALTFKATSTTAQVLSSGTGTLIRPVDVRITASNPIPGQKTALSYAGTVTRAGTLSAVRMQLPTGASGAVTSVNGRLTTSGGYATWQPRTPLSLRAGARLSIPIYGLLLSRYGGILRLTMTATGSTGSVLLSGRGTLALIDRKSVV